MSEPHRQIPGQQKMSLINQTMAADYSSLILGLETVIAMMLVEYDRQHTGQVTQFEQDYERSTIDTEKNEQMVPMTAEDNLWNDRSKRFGKVLFFSDTGAHKTIIEEN
ncbi:unnamed protein product [Haemonchus placei]|uniref:DUF1758 domain-containing protein n=1 Tax=Haemonchus placei TaxID=6290 RepID=A0A0N4WYY5_HAEPC|nr:unnamed protein product [Haemonchus placei]